jgi:hypothetical protein
VLAETDDDASLAQLRPLAVPTFLLTLMHAKAVPDSGLGARTVCVRRARLCLFDGAKFVGNAVVVDTCQPDPKKPWNWSFIPSAVRLLHPSVSLLRAQRLQRPRRRYRRGRSGCRPSDAKPRDPVLFLAIWS